MKTTSLIPALLLSLLAGACGSSDTKPVSDIVTPDVPRGTSSYKTFLTYCEDKEASAQGAARHRSLCNCSLQVSPRLCRTQSRGGLYLRWVASAHNCADGPSRGMRRPGVALETVSKAEAARAKVWQEFADDRDERITEAFSAFDREAD